MRTPGALVALVLGTSAGCATAVPPKSFDDPTHGGWVYVSGDVAHPGRCPVVRGRKPFTLAMLLAMSDPVGDPKLVEVARPGVGLLTYDFDAVLHCVIDDPALEPDDVVTVTARR